MIVIGIHHGARTQIHGIEVSPVTLSRMSAIAKKSKTPAVNTFCFISILPPVVVVLLYYRFCGITLLGAVIRCPHIPGDTFRVLILNTQVKSSDKVLGDSLVAVDYTDDLGAVSECYLDCVACFIYWSVSHVNFYLA